LDIPEGAMVARALEMLNIPDEEVEILLVNGRNSHRETVLKERDVLTVFPYWGRC